MSRDIFEQRDKLSPKGSGLMIRPGAPRILQSWGLVDAIEHVADTYLPFSIRDLKTDNDKVRALPASLSKVTTGRFTGDATCLLHSFVLLFRDVI
ncbi:hypothetical protein N7451_012177 [Penicillium sp. IBT 35674x]|nr:hypothetical protein N7451_012177 [Penicillium sp. IBT 35674x]